MSMRIIYQLGEVDSYDANISLEKIDEAISMFVDRYEMIPDTVEMHHQEFRILHSAVFHNQNPTIIYGKDLNDIKIRTYLGPLRVSIKFKKYERTIDMVNNGVRNAYFVVENVEANKVDKILLGDEESNS